MPTDSNLYWAALDSDSIVGELNKRVDSYYRFLWTNGLLTKWRKAYLSYYGCNAEKSSWQVNASGEQGELSVLVSNEYRNLVNHLLVLTTQSRPTMECRGANTDFDTQIQCILGTNLLEYYRSESKLERRLKDATEIALVLDAGYVLATWDVMLGDAVTGDPMTGAVLHNGDISYKALTPLDVIYDYTKRDADDNEWYITRDYVNKYDLAAQFPEYANDLVKIGRNESDEQIYRFDNFFYNEGVDSADIPRFTFYHKKSPSMPNGRLTQFAKGIKKPLYDGPIPYRKLPVVRVAAGEMIAKSWGYSPGTDLMGLQDVVDTVISAAVTNLTAFGVGNVWAPPGSNLEVTQLIDGMNYFESKVKPEAINFTHFPPELMPFLQFAIARMETLSGVNSVARGNPPEGDMSGSAMALIQSMALQFNSGLQQSFVELLEAVGQLTINHLQDFAKSPRIAMIAGKASLYQAKMFQAQDIEGIQRVHVDMSNPLSQTVSGRMTMAQDLLKNGLVKNAQQYIMVMSTGRLEPLIEGEQALLLSLRQENEALQNGQQVPVIAIERHDQHINAHYELIASPSAKMDPNLVQNVLAHIQNHMNEWRTIDPQLAQVLGIPLLPPPPPPPGMLPPGSHGPPGPAHMQSAQPHPPVPPGGHMDSPPSPGQKVLNSTNPTQEKAEKVKQPNMPKNPLSGQAWSPQTGGLPPGGT